MKQWPFPNCARTDRKFWPFRFHFRLKQTTASAALAFGWAACIFVQQCATQMGDASPRRIHLNGRRRLSDSCWSRRSYSCWSRLWPFGLFLFINIRPWASSWFYLAFGLFNDSSSVGVNLMNFVGTTVLKQSAPSEGLGRLLLGQTLSKHIGRLYLVQAALKKLK